MHSSVAAFAGGLIAFLITGYVLTHVWVRRVPKAKPAPRPAYRLPSWREFPRDMDRANAAKARQWWKTPK
jgi:hypothetical protein